MWRINTFLSIQNASFLLEWFQRNWMNPMSGNSSTPSGRLRSVPCWGTLVELAKVSESYFQTWTKSKRRLFALELEYLTISFFLVDGWTFGKNAKWNFPYVWCAFVRIFTNTKYSELGAFYFKLNLKLWCFSLLPRKENSNISFGISVASCHEFKNLTCFKPNCLLFLQVFIKISIDLKFEQTETKSYVLIRSYVKVFE